MNQRKHSIPSPQRGVALIFSLLLLMVMTIVGIATMSSANMQQRMAGNSYLQAQAFEAASAGVASSLEFRDSFWPASATCNTSTADEWYGDWQNMGTYGNGEARLQQRMYCLPFTNDDEGGGVAGYELFVLNRGEVLSGDRVVATRDIEVRIGRFGAGLSDPCNGAAMCFPIQPDLELGQCDPGSSGFCGCIEDINPFDGFNSNAFTVVGEEYGDFGHGPAIALPPHYMLAFECTVTGGQTAEQCEAGGNQGRCARLGNYIDSMVATTEFGEPWDDPETAFEFADALRNESIANGNHIGPGHSDWGIFNAGPGETWAGADWGGNSETDLGSSVTYVDGDALLSGNVSGSGILVIEGRMKWNGTPQFDGLIIALGGVFDVSGGGTGGDGAGSLVVLDLQPKPSAGLQLIDPITGEVLDVISPFYGDSFDISFSGGGTAQYAYGCDELWSTHDQLPGPIQDLWAPNCDPDAEGAPIGVVEGIASWRENIGWRQETFPGAQTDP